jgi:hypothetical protein
MPKAVKVEDVSGEAVVEYKRILAEVLDRRPSGTRQRLAAALGKNRSFISQICSAAYPTPIPQGHVETIIEICHFNQVERTRFLTAYSRAHPRKLHMAPEPQRLKAHTIYLPDLGSSVANDRLHKLVTDFVRELARTVGQGRGK